MKTDSNTRTFAKSYLAIGMVISLMAIYQTQLQTQALMKIRSRYKWVILMAVFAINAAISAYLVFRRADVKLDWKWLGFNKPGVTSGKIAGLVLVLIPVLILWYAKADFFGRGLEASFRLLWLYWWLVLMQAAGLKLILRLSWAASLALILVLDGTAAQVYTLTLPLTNYPFSLSWSEASRFYYGSLVFSKAVYGAQVPLSIWHGSRYLLLALPFLLNNPPIWLARLWQVILWLGITALASWSLSRRLRPREWKSATILACWFFLFLFQGAVYYHLLICVIIIFLGVTADHPWRSMGAILAASFWAGMSRLNWYPVPAMLACALYFLEVPIRRTASQWLHLRTLALWITTGLLAAFAGQAFYIGISGNTNLEAFGSSLTSALLWYRLLPSATNPIGIIPGVLIVSLSMWVLIIEWARPRLSGLQGLRWLGLAGMLVILLVGGLIVSTKIGGGGDLHNMDAYLVLLALIGAYCAFGKVALGDAQDSKSQTSLSSSFAWVLFVPVAFSILRISPPFSYDPVKAAAEVSEVGREVEAYAKSGEILFMYERQLLTFGMIPQTPLVPEYEVVSLMEMAISGNQPYLKQFYEDLEGHRFAAIVAHPQNLGVETGDFIEESTVWNRLVAQPMLCQYKPVVTFDYSNIQILIPRAKPCLVFPPVVAEP